MAFRPVGVGLSYTRGSHGGEKGNLDGATDHWVMVLGRGYEADGAVYYWGIGYAGTSKKEVVKLHVDPTTMGLYSMGPAIEFGGGQRYRGTNARSVTPKP